MYISKNHHVYQHLTRPSSMCSHDTDTTIPIGEVSENISWRRSDRHPTVRAGSKNFKHQNSTVEDLEHVNYTLNTIHYAQSRWSVAIGEWSTL